MPFFAVLIRPDASDRQLFEVEQCHINLWALRGLWPGRRRFYLDVGVRIKAGDGEAIKGFSLVLPFGVEAHLDLTPLLKDERKVTELIFDSDIGLPTDPSDVNNKVITVNEDRMRLQAVKDVDDVDAKPEVSIRDFAYVTPLPPGETGYARVRFPINNLGSTWQWQRTSGQRSGAILDFRVLDQRSTATLKNGTEIRARTKTINTVAVFAMVPSWLHGRAINPAAKYMRVLESREWTPYLKRVPEFGDKPMVVFSWKGNAVSLAKPLRIYADFTMRRKSTPILLSLALVALAIVAVGVIYELPVRANVTGVLEDGWSWLQSWFELLLGAGVITVLLFLFKVPGRLAQFFKFTRGIRAGFRALEDWIFEKLA